MLLALALTLTLGDVSPRYTTRSCSRGPGGRSTRGLPCETAAPFFEFAPANGAGMGATCACAAVTGSKGESVTWTRGSSAICTRQGLATTGLNSSSMVLCGSNQPRVVLDAQGNQGVLVEAGTTNLSLRSEDFGTTPWVLASLGVAAPTFTPNAGTDMAGAFTADRIQVAACPTLSHYSVLSNPGGAPFNVTPHTASIYIRAFPGSGAGVIGLYANSSPVVAAEYVQCPYLDNGTWSRCQLPGTGTTIAEWGVGCVNVAAYPGSGNTGAADVLVWGGQFEQKAYATSYVLTLGTSVARAADDSNFASITTPPFGATSAGGGCVSATEQCFNLSGGRYVTLTQSTGTALEWDTNYAGASTQWAGGTTTSWNSTLARDTNSRRWIVSAGAAGSQFTMCRDGACASGGSRGGNTAGNLTGQVWLGNYVSPGFSCDGVISRVQVDPSPARCN